MNERTADRPDDLTGHVMAHGCPAATDHDREVPEIEVIAWGGALRPLREKPA